MDELHRSIVARRGLFAKCKFDLLSRDTSCLLGAFRNLVVQLMVTDAEQWKARILRALSPNAQVLCDVVPELTRLLGEQPPVPVLGTAETANRLNMCFLQFVGCLATSSSPLVLFVDDLQWVRLGMTAQAVRSGDHVSMSHRMCIAVFMALPLRCSILRPATGRCRCWRCC